MGYEILFNFISPVTGRILCDPGKVLVGDPNGIAIPSSILPPGSLYLPFNNLFIGNSLNQAVPTPIIFINNLPNLGFGNAWIGNSDGRPVEAKLASLIKVEVKNNLEVNPIFNITPFFFVTSDSVPFRGINGKQGLAGPPGAASVSGSPTIYVRANFNMNGNRIENIAPSPQADYDAVNAKWVMDLLNDEVEIVWEQDLTS